jgi:hypothetical protein
VAIYVDAISVTAGYRKPVRSYNHRLDLLPKKALWVSKTARQAFFRQMKEFLKNMSQEGVQGVETKRNGGEGGIRTPVRGFNP